MSYQVLARKWRPSTFREMVGQQHVLRALTNALDHDRLHHAYLFTGTRGVGKTTVARILAKCLNCETGVSSEPCGQCGSCREIAEGRAVDLIEVDAASRTKVDDTRELLDNVQYRPSHARFKIYLIDEVHMLSKHSFNALLKTLEEPPPHAKFLLATTDPQLLPPTVLSRCLQFNLKNMLPEQIVEHLQHVLNDEAIRSDEQSLILLARAAAGSMRDALSLTDQAIAYGSGALVSSEVSDMLGTVDRSRVLHLVQAVLVHSPQEVLSGVAEIAQHAPDYSACLDEFTAILHQITIAQLVPDAVDPTWLASEQIAALAAASTADEIHLMYQFATRGRDELRFAADPRVAMEMLLLRMLAFRPAEAIVASAEGAVSAGAPPSKKPEPPVLPVVPEPTNARSTSPSDATAEQGSAVASESARSRVAVPKLGVVGERAPASEHTSEHPTERAQAAQSVRSDALAAEASREAIDEQEIAVSGERPTPETWPDVFERLGLVGITQNVALHCQLMEVHGDVFSFILDSSNATLYQPRQARAIAASLSAFVGADVEVAITVGELSGLTPAAQRERRRLALQAEAEQAIASDPLVKQLLAEFDGEIVTGSIQPVD